MAIPVVLFAYARPAHLARTLASLRENEVPLLLVFSDGPRNAADAEAVAETRALIREIDWCEVRLVERAQNLGLGRSVRIGVGENAAQFESFIVFEDDLVCVPGTYAWLCAALRHYRDDPRVMSVTAWTHPRITPRALESSPYFDARAECWVWGTWSRAWRGMEEGTALEKSRAAQSRGWAPDAYGADLPVQAAYEEIRNVWAVRWLYHHFQNDGLCLRPPWSMVEHIGFDRGATNVTAADAGAWANPPLASAPPIPVRWPEPRVNSECRNLWCAANPGGWRRLLRRAKERLLRA